MTPVKLLNFSTAQHARHVYLAQSVVHVPSCTEGHPWYRDGAVGIQHWLLTLGKQCWRDGFVS